jgi:hypothetical protein
MTTEVSECINIEKEASDNWLRSRQDLHKEIYKEKQKAAAKALIKAKNKEMWNETCSKIMSWDSKAQGKHWQH